MKDEEFKTWLQACLQIADTLTNAQKQQMFKALTTDKRPLSEAALNRAIEHLCKFGDTDVFPHLPELKILSDLRQDPALIKVLRELNLDEYLPAGAFEALGPKGRYSFRITHQLSALDNVLFLAAVVQIGDKIEALRHSTDGIEAFSYRFDKGGKDGLFLDGHTYKDWLKVQRDHLVNHLNVKFVIATDIADFYARVNYHRLENLLDTAAPENGAAKYIKKFIKVIRAKKSYGLPVGGAAARILAELVLVNTDKALKDKQISATRFVDDFRIFVKNDQHPYDAISFLAQHLAGNEGLSLNSAKTRVFSREDFLSHVKGQINHVADQAQGQALDILTASRYDDEPDPEDIKVLLDLNLVELLKEEVSKNDLDIGGIKVIFRALRIAKPVEAIDYVIENFSKLIFFAKELVLLMEELKKENPDCFTGLTQNVISAILKPPASSVPVIRIWLLELFVRDVVPLRIKDLEQLSNLSFILDKRQLNIIRGRLEHQNYFSDNKDGACAELPRFELFSFVIGAKCLPKDEFKSWHDLLMQQLNSPFEKLFLKWLLSSDR